MRSGASTSERRRQQRGLISRRSAALPQSLPAGKDMAYWQTLRDFCTAYFKRTAAILKTYSVLRDPPDLAH